MSSLRLLVCFFLYLSQAEGTSGGTCFKDDYRIDCGYYGISERQCILKGCCYDKKDNVPWCFQAVAEGCTMKEEGREDCGYIGISEYECEVKRGCCFVPTSKPNAPWCFHNSENVLPHRCRVMEKRNDCGNFGINEKECNKIGCCWDPRKNQPWCFSSASTPEPVPTTSMPLPYEPNTQAPPTEPNTTEPGIPIPTTVEPEYPIPTELATEIPYSTTLPAPAETPAPEIPFPPCERAVSHRQSVDLLNIRGFKLKELSGFVDWLSKKLQEKRLE